jgi:type VI secretion system protein ImpE
MPIEDIFDLVERARPAEALASAQEQARANPSDAALRTLLFELYCVAGQWDRAASHAALAPTLDARADSLSRYAPAMIAAERKRLDVFSGAAAPIVPGTAQPWSDVLVEAHKASLAGDAPRAAELRAAARAQAPAISGRIDGRAAAAISDADDRFGPLLELFVAGTYAWVPLTLISVLTLQPPRRIIDRVWINGEVTLVDGHTSGVVIPVRYPGSDRAPLGPAALAASTEWSGGHPVGQRLFSTGPGQDDVPILSIQRIELDQPASAPASPESAP